MTEALVIKLTEAIQTCTCDLLRCTHAPSGEEITSWFCARPITTKTNPASRTSVRNVWKLWRRPKNPILGLESSKNTLLWPKTDILLDGQRMVSLVLMALTTVLLVQGKCTDVILSKLITDAASTLELGFLEPMLK